MRLLSGGVVRGGGDCSLDGADPVVVAEQIAVYLAERAGESGLEATISLHRRGRVVSFSVADHGRAPADAPHRDSV